MSGDGWTWTLREVLGQGGFGTVYRAHGVDGAGFEREAAIKLLREPNPSTDLLQRFRDEARIGALVRDRAVVPVEPPVVIGGRWVVVMGYIDGVPLDAVLRARAPLPAGIAADLVAELARALDAVHGAKGPDGAHLDLVHRDVKPANVMLTASGEVKLLDFGMAYGRFRGREAETRLDLGGTLGYIAPERLQGVEGPAGDVYSLGALLVDCLRPPGSKGSGAERIEADAASSGATPTSAPQQPARTMTVEGDAIAAASAAPQFPAADLDDPDPGTRLLLELAEQMCAPVAHRPTMRQVERRCQQLAADHRAVSLRDWCEQHVPEDRRPWPSDALVGSVLGEKPRPVTRRWAPLAAAAVVVAALGGYAAFGLATAGPAPLAAAGAVTGAVTGAVSSAPPEPSPVAPPAPQPEAPALASPPAEVAAPSPTARAATIRPPIAKAEQEAPEEPVTAPPAAAQARVEVYINTKPRGKVSIDGGPAQSTRAMFPLEVGAHTLSLSTTAGDKTVTLQVVEGQESAYCWDFERQGEC